MLPSNPRNGMARGLANNPNPRSRSLGRDVPSSENTTRSRSASRHSHRQRYTRRSSPTPPIPGSSKASQSYSSNSRSSYATDTSSSGSSSYDRHKLGSGYTSSRTSLDDNRKALTSSRSSLEGKNESNSNPRGGSSAIWSRVATVASTLTLTVSVGRAWASNIASQAGEETPVGQESRLTRAMKAYHLEKAHDPTDLPAWLFEERERRTNAYQSSMTETRRINAAKTSNLPLPRNAYDAQVPTTPFVAPIPSTFNANPTKGIDRLKAMRDAKRSIPGAGVMPRHSSVKMTEDKSQHNGNPKGITPHPRMGLPSGPRRTKG